MEAAFSRFEAWVGTIRLDDRSKETLIDSAVREVLRAFIAATNGVPREQLAGRSRLASLRAARPSAAQQAADRALIQALKERHERLQRSHWWKKIKPAARRLLDQVFSLLALEDRDPSGKLRDFLATYEAAAIRQAAAIVASRMERGHVQREFAHRYLAKVIQACQESLDLERQEVVPPARSAGDNSGSLLQCAIPRPHSRRPNPAPSPRGTTPDATSFRSCRECQPFPRWMCLTSTASAVGALGT